MLVDYDSLVKEISRVLSKSRLAAHWARVKALSTLLQGLLLLWEVSLSGMGRGAALLDEEKTFRGQLKRAFRFLNNPQFDPWEMGNALFGRLTQGLKGGADCGGLDSGRRFYDLGSHSGGGRKRHSVL